MCGVLLYCVFVCVGVGCVISGLLVCWCSGLVMDCGFVGFEVCCFVGCNLGKDVCVGLFFDCVWLGSVLFFVSVLGLIWFLHIYYRGCFLW